MKKLLYFLLTACVLELCAMDPQGQPDLKRTKVTMLQSAQELMQAANTHYQQKRYEDARNCFEAALPQAQTLNELFLANFALGELYGIRLLKTKDHLNNACLYLNNALKVLDAAQTSKEEETCVPQRCAVLRNLANICFSAAKHEEVIKYGQQAIALETKPATIAELCHLVGTSFRANDPETSCTYLKRGIENIFVYFKHNEQKILTDLNAAQLYGRLHKELANTLYVQKCFPQAQGQYLNALKFIQSLSDKADIWVQLGLLYHKNANAVFAETCFEKAGQEIIKTTNPTAYNFAQSWLKRYSGSNS